MSVTTRRTVVNTRVSFVSIVAHITRFRLSMNKLSSSAFLALFTYYLYALVLINRVNPSVTNRNHKYVDIRQQSKATIPVVVLKDYDPIATSTLLFYIWVVSMIRHHLLVTSAFVWYVVSVRNTGVSSNNLINFTHTGKVLAFYLKHLLQHTSLSTNHIVSSLAAGRPINVWPDIFQHRVMTSIIPLHVLGLYIRAIWK